MRCNHTRKIGSLDQHNTAKIDARHCFVAFQSLCQLIAPPITKWFAYKTAVLQAWLAQHITLHTPAKFTSVTVPYTMPAKATRRRQTQLADRLATRMSK
jgi:hypothetical protein